MANFPDSIRAWLAAGMFLLAAFLYFVVVKMEKMANQDEFVSNPVQNETHQISSPDVRESPTAFGGTGSIASPMKTRPAVPEYQEGKVFGENPEITFQKDLDTSLEIQSDPGIWLDFVDQGGEKIRVNISTAHRTAFSRTWLSTLRLANANKEAINYEARIEVQKHYLNNGANFLVYLEDVEISTPYGKRRLSENEAGKITRVLNLLALQRFEELAAMDREVRSRKVIDAEPN